MSDINIEKRYFEDDHTLRSIETRRMPDQALHNLQGPAVTFFYKNGGTESVLYCVNGVMHREGGPAFLYYDEKGKEMGREYWINGKQICTCECGGARAKTTHSTWCPAYSAR